VTVDSYPWNNACQKSKRCTASLRSPRVVAGEVPGLQDAEDLSAKGPVTCWPLPNSPQWRVIFPVLLAWRGPSIAAAG